MPDARPDHPFLTDTDRIAFEMIRDQSQAALDATAETDVITALMAIVGALSMLQETVD